MGVTGSLIKTTEGGSDTTGPLGGRYLKKLTIRLAAASGLWTFSTQRLSGPFGYTVCLPGMAAA